MHAPKALASLLLALAVAAGARASEFAALPVPAPAPGPVNNAPPAPAPVHPPAPALAAPHAERAAGRFYADLNYLFAWLDSGRVPPLVTTSTLPLPRGLAGVEGVGGNRVLFGDHAVGEDARPGLLLRVGYALDGECRQGFEFGLFLVGRAGDTFSAVSDGSQVLARPFFNTVTGANDAQLVAFPGLLAGTVRVRTATDLVGTEVSYRCALSCLSCGACGCGDGGCCPGSGLNLDFLIGYRGVRYRSKVTTDELTRNLDDANPVTNRPVVHDSFYAKTHFNGVQIGLAGRWERGDFYLDGRATAALGQATSRVDINGFSDVNTNGVLARQRVGLLTGRTNINYYNDDETGFVSELSLKAGYRLTGSLSVSAGFTLLYLSSVVRAGDLIDRAVNTTQIPPATLVGPNRPALLIQDQDVWARGVTLGVEWKY